MNLVTNTAAIRETLAELARVAGEANDTAGTNALNQAAYQIAKGVLTHIVVDVTGDLLIPSKGDTGTVYRTAQYSCTCTAGKSGKQCWHTALFEGVQTAQERATAWNEAPAEPAPVAGVVATIAAVTEAVHGLTDAEYLALVADSGPAGPPADSWEAFCQARARGESASWEPDDVAYWFGD